ncbi:MAG: AGE family epimerase/isomerase [Lachnospiraceae bacterium]|nr:AGE family epimerase/isomerase [Lachnospiraceae bacterium]
MMIREIRRQLEEGIIPFWKNLKDDENGGFYGEVDYNLNIDKGAYKGVILNSRILWFFSNSFLTLRNEDDLRYADHAFDFLVNVCVDKEYGGVYWSVTNDGAPLDTTKHTYCQAFAVYALSSYYDATGNEQALKLAYDIYDIMEQKCRDEIGYLEAFKRDFTPESNEKLSLNGVIAHRTMNTLLHVFEAYTELYRVDRNNEVRESIEYILDIMCNKVYNDEKKRLEVFFDYNMNSIIDLHSYGHDIETAWLVDRGLMVLGDQELSVRVGRITAALEEKIYDVAYTNQGLLYENDRGEIDKTRVWWVQNEAVIGFVNAYQKDKSNTKYFNAAKSIWDFSKEKMIDKRANSEWIYELDENLMPNTSREIAGPWKCPYHNGRMCFEIIRRNVDA